MSEPEKNGTGHLTSAERQKIYRERAESRRRAAASKTDVVSIWSGEVFLFSTQIYLAAIYNAVPMW